MKLYKNRKAQSMIEYAILLAVVISAFILLQAIVKRGVSGGINDAASRMGDQYSVSNSTIQEERTMDNDKQNIVEEAGIDAGTGDESLRDVMSPLIEDAAVGAEVASYDLVGAIDHGANNINTRIGQKYTSETKQATDSTDVEVYKTADYQSADYSHTFGNLDTLWDDEGGDGDGN